MFRTSPVHHQERFVQAVFADLVCGNTRTAGHVQPLQSVYVCMYICMYTLCVCALCMYVGCSGSKERLPLLISRRATTINADEIRNGRYVRGLFGK